MGPLFLLRYDTEGAAEDTHGFLTKAVQLHRADEIPATLFCKGQSLDGREGEFRDFWAEVRDDPLFDVQDHSYTHIGLGYEVGNPVDVLRADYQRSFDSHERIFGSRPIGVSICGTGGRDGKRLGGFDQTDKGREEFEMIVSLGVRMINSHLTDVDESRSFCNYGRLGHPEVMGFPSGYSDTRWFFEKDYTSAIAYILSEIDRRAAAGEHFPLMLHDWCAFKCAATKDLAHVRIIAEHAREVGYTLVTHAACLANAALWAEPDV